MLFPKRSRKGHNPSYFPKPHMQGIFYFDENASLFKSDEYFAY